jgi:hypothetical protein
MLTSGLLTTLTSGLRKLLRVALQTVVILKEYLALVAFMFVAIKI